MAEPAIRPIRVGPKGRVVLPVEARRALGIDEGDDLVVQVEDDTIKLMKRGAAIKRLQAMFADYEGSLVDELLAMRRAEVERENRKMDELMARHKARIEGEAGE